MGEITKEKLREILLNQSVKDLIAIRVVIYDTKENIIDDILNRSAEDIEAALWNGLKWKFEIKEE
jgi:hypothetical protein